MHVTGLTWVRTALFLVACLHVNHCLGGHRRRVRAAGTFGDQPFMSLTSPVRHKRHSSGADPWALCPRAMESVDCFKEYLRVYASLRRTRPGATAVSVRNIGKRAQSQPDPTGLAPNSSGWCGDSNHISLLCLLRAAPATTRPRKSGGVVSRLTPCADGEGSSIGCRDRGTLKGLFHPALSFLGVASPRMADEGL